MPELRKDPIIGRWVIIATERAKRPLEFVRDPVKSPPTSFCPFCYGHEDKTPPELLAQRSNGTLPDTPGWGLRVVPNKFPALGIEGALDRQGEGLFDKMNGIGAHEVIIETPDHEAALASLSQKRIEDVLWAYRDRMVDLKKDKRFKYVMIFKNYGEVAGATFSHGHSQLIALPIVPKRVREEVDGAKQYYMMKERCIFCDLIRQERQSGVRVVDENEHFITLSPYAARFPFETWILPKHHAAAFEDAAASVYEHLAKALKGLLQRIDKLLDQPPYNYVIHTSPVHEDTEAFFHWHIELMPRLSKVAGFEWGTGFYINPTPPEHSAQCLRDTGVAAAP
ncbi:MAG: galactose-1-phosphate uridylyltransferase [Terriglobia bacterium]